MSQYDVIVVGARCAGATLATLLARASVRSLLLDSDALPSDMPMSTHLIQPPGMDVLDDLGVGAAIRALTPATRRMRLRVDATDLYSEFPDGRAAFCARRLLVDRLLQDAAVAAGAELRDRHRVVDLLRDGDRVSGVVVETPQGRQAIRAALVVGADGRHSTVARLAGVEQYQQFSMNRGGYFFYFPTPPMWHDDPRYQGWDMFVGWEGDGLRYIFQCDGDLLLMVAGAPLAQAQTWGADYRARSIDYLRQSEITGPLMDVTAPMGKGVGSLRYEGFYRRPVGPGFALVGDAGTAKDFVTGHGMAEAFLGARELSKAILDGSERAYQRFWLERDVNSMPLFFNAKWLGDVGFNDALTRRVFAEQARDAELASRVGQINDRRRSAFELFPMSLVTKVVLRSMLRGQFEVVSPFLATGSRLRRDKADYARSLARLRRLGPAA